MRDDRLGADVRIALAAALLLTAVGLAIGDTTAGIFFTIVVFLLVVYMMFRVPLRHSMLALMFLALALPNPADCTPSDKWDPPFYTLGAIVLNHLNTVDRNYAALSWCSFSGIDVLIVILLGIAMFRRATGSQIDRRGAVATPKPLVQLALLALVAPAIAWVFGMLRGGEFRWSLWQLDQVVHLPLIFLLFHFGLRGPKDHAALSRVLLYAAGYKALLALYIMMTVQYLDPDGSPHLSYMTSHSDSMLFAAAFVWILAVIFERVKGYAWKTALLFFPLLAAGTWANNRRIAWVQAGLVFLTVFVVSRESPIKRKIKRWILLSSPLAVLYLLIGWNSGRAIFKPARIARSVIDAQTDSSSFWRELENFDLIQTVRGHPIFGTGYGHPYDEIIELPKVYYSLELYVPHNCILGLWAYIGVLGYTALTLLWVVGVYFAMRAYYMAKEPSHRHRDGR
jgi:O-antigen ligase